MLRRREEDEASLGGLGCEWEHWCFSDAQYGREDSEEARIASQIFKLIASKTWDVALIPRAADGGDVAHYDHHVVREVFLWAAAEHGERRPVIEYWDLPYLQRARVEWKLVDVGRKREALLRYASQMANIPVDQSDSYVYREFSAPCVAYEAWRVLQGG